MISRYKGAIVLLSMLLFHSSCTDMLDEKPKSIIYESSVTSAKELELSVVGAYRGFTQNYDGQTYWKKLAPVDGWGTMGTDLWEMEPGRNGADVKFGRYEMTPDNNDVKTFWKQYYMIINRVNYILDIAANLNIPEEQKAPFIAEAKFLRAFCYFELGKYFGGVPLRLKHAESVAADSDVKRSTEKEVFAQIVSDLEDAEQNLPEKAIPGRATKWIAKAFLSKVYLFGGGYLFNYEEKDYLKKALVKADEVIKSGKYTLNPTEVGNPAAFKQYGKQFTASGENSPESIFEIQFETGELGGGWGYRSVNGGMNTEKGEFGTYYYFWGGHRVSTDFALSFNDSDIRFQWSIAPYKLLPKDKSRKAQSGDWWTPAKYRNEQKVSGWDNPTNCVVLRLAEMYLLYAEAYNEYYGAPESATAAGEGFAMSAYDAINKVRERAQVTPMNKEYLMADSPFSTGEMLNYSMSTESFNKQNPLYDGRHVYYKGNDEKERFRDAILMERAWELCFEIHRWFDLKRMHRTREIVQNVHLLGQIMMTDVKDPIDKTKLNMLPSLSIQKPYITSGRIDQENIFYLPIPRHELDYNGLMDDADQNPGY